MNFYQGIKYYTAIINTILMRGSESSLPKKRRKRQTRFNNQ